MTLDEGMTRRIEWPENAFFHGSIPGAGPRRGPPARRRAQLPLAHFHRPHLGLAADLGVELVVTLGALLADVPHTRAAPVTGAATDPALVEELGLQLSRYEGPTGIVGVLHDACRAAGSPVREPLVGGAALRLARPSPRAAKALCERLGTLLGVDIDSPSSPRPRRRTSR